MDRDNYEVDIKTWASSLLELEDRAIPTDGIDSTNSIVALSSSYYRTKAFSSTIGVNNIINAADPLLTLATKLRRINVPADAASLHQNICHEIKAFENKAQNFGYRPQLILAARYVLCALLDELIAITLWPDLNWKKYSLVDYFHKDLWDSDHFFLILDRSLQDPETNIDLMELIYLCLRLGYEGKYRNIERGLLELGSITENLLATISYYKEEFSKGFYISPIPFNYLQTRKKSYLHLLPPSWVVSLIMATILLILFGCCYLSLHQTAAPITQYLNDVKNKPMAPLTDNVGAGY
jgi:type VI secretion system protein ImpK